MALTKEKKQQVVTELETLLERSKLTVFARYPGTSVKSLQLLRSQSRENGTVVRVTKNRLLKKALLTNERLNSIDTSVLTGQLIYAFNDDDEVAPAQSLANFAKTEVQIELMGAITFDGNLLSADEVKVLAALPSKDQLRAILAGTIAAPLNGLANVLSGNVRGVITVLGARARQITT